MIPVTHYFTHYQTLGGVQSLLRQHREMDAQWGMDSNIVAYFDPNQDSNPQVHGLGLTWKSTIRNARREFSVRLARQRRRVAVYNNLWGVPFFSDLDGAERRIGVLHVYPRELGDCLSANSGLVDGVLCVSQPLKNLVHRYLPELEESRVPILPLPIASCPFAVEHQPLQNRPIVVGFNGRLVKEQKRVDRLPELTRALDEAGLNYRLELLGDGPDQVWLERRLKGHRRVCFHGRLAGQDYWKVLASWDAILFTSDFEGLPISLLEALSAGVLPIYPRIESGGDAYAEKVGPECLYNPGNLDDAARLLADLVSASAEKVGRWRAQCQRLVQPHLGDAYLKTFSDFIHRMAEQPRISASVFPSRGFHWTDFCPFAVLRRVWMRGFYQRNGG